MSVTYKEMNLAREEFTTARQVFNHKYHDFLTTVLKEAGIFNKLVKIKDKDFIGQFKIADSPSARQPWEIKFFPLTKTGTIYLKSKYLTNLYSWKEDTLIKQLQEIAEVVGEA